MARKWTEEDRKAAGDRLRAARQKKEQERAAGPPEPKQIGLDEETHIAPDQDLNELRAQMKEVMETNALLKAAILKQQDAPTGDNSGQILSLIHI